MKENFEPKLEDANEERENFLIQEREPFADEIEDQNKERRKISEKEKKIIEEDLKNLGHIFRDSDIKWQLDGALNISLMNIAQGGDFIGAHKDVDISLEAEQIEKLNEALIKNGYGLFLSFEKQAGNKKSARIMKRIKSQKDFEEAVAVSDDFMIAAMDEKGKISKGKNLDFIDAHFIKRNSNGEPIGHGGVVLPEEWLAPQPMEFHGEVINLSHPARAAYYKLHAKRSYDVKDLEILAETGELTSADMAEMDRLIKEEALNYKKRGAMALKPIWGKIKKDMDSEQIFKLFANEPNLKAGERAGEFRKFSEYLAENKKAPFEDTLEMAMEIFSDAREKENLIYRLHKIAEDAEQKKSLRKNI